MVDSTALACEILKLGHRVRIPTIGTSMYPHIRFGEVIHIETVDIAGLVVGDIVVYTSGRRMVAHRVIRMRKDAEGPFVLAKGDSFHVFDHPVRAEQVIGKVVAIERNGRTRRLGSSWRRVLARIWALISPASRWIYPAIGRTPWASRFLLRLFGGRARPCPNSTLSRKRAPGAVAVPPGE
ncbi:MAG: signal peptidase I [Dehalococcoidia bacterium]|nr:signal peptidase I [Dehalococcoidia bacterium]